MKEFEKALAASAVSANLLRADCTVAEAREPYARDARGVARRESAQAELPIDAIPNLEAELMVSQMALEATLLQLVLAEQKLAVMTSEQQNFGEKLAQTEAQLKSAEARLGEVERRECETLARLSNAELLAQEGMARADATEQKVLAARKQKAEADRRAREVGAGLKELLDGVLKTK